MGYIGNQITTTFPSSISVDDATISGNTTIGGTLGVTGASTLSSTLAVTGVSTLSDNIVFDASSKGVHLGVTSATSTNLLDDYEEGTFTAQIIGSTTNPSSAVTQSSARYTKTGRTVYCTFQFTNVDTTGASGGVRVSGLPFTANGAQATGNVMTYVRMTLASTARNISPYVGGTQISFYQSNSQAGWGEIIHSAGTGAYLSVSVTYETT